MISSGFTLFSIGDGDIPMKPLEMCFLSVLHAEVKLYLGDVTFRSLETGRRLRYRNRCLSVWPAKTAHKGSVKKSERMAYLFVCT